jgi:hypothetical protein
MLGLTDAVPVLQEILGWTLVHGLLSELSRKDITPWSVFGFGSPGTEILGKL